MSIFKGAATALSTPLTENGVNFSVFEALIEYQISGHIDGLLVLGTTGEPSTMTQKERVDAASFVIKQAAGRVPVIVGTGGNNTAAVVEATKNATDLGADAILVVTPYYNKCTQDGLIKHYEAVAAATKLPILVYNVPARTGVNILPSTLRKIAEIDNIAGIKEASGCITQIAEIGATCTDKIDMYSGNDDHILPLLSLGGLGVISVISNLLPQDTHDIVEAYFNGDVARATALQNKQFGLYRALFCEVNPIPVKAALNMIGFDMGVPRLPLTEATEATKQLLKKELIAYGLEIK